MTDDGDVLFLRGSRSEFIMGIYIFMHGTDGRWADRTRGWTRRGGTGLAARSRDGRNRPLNREHRKTGGPRGKYLVCELRMSPKGSRTNNGKSLTQKTHKIFVDAFRQPCWYCGDKRYSRYYYLYFYVNGMLVPSYRATAFLFSNELNFKSTDY